MAIRLKGITKAELWSWLNWYDAIVQGREESSFDLDFFLHARSAAEFVISDFTDPERVRLTKIDAFLMAHPQEFNACFEWEHRERDLSEELDGFVVDGEGKVPSIPRAHWWWWPLVVGEDVP